MSDSKISLLPAAAAITTAEFMALAQAGVSVQAAISAVFLAMTTKISINNNASGTLNVNPTTPVTLINFTGSNVANLTVNFPAASAAIDGYTIIMSSVAGVATLSILSTGATFPSPTPSFSANGRTGYTFQFSTLQWLRS